MSWWDEPWVLDLARDGGLRTLHAALHKHGYDVPWNTLRGMFIRKGWPYKREPYVNQYGANTQGVCMPHTPVQEFTSNKKQRDFYWRDILPPLAELQRQMHAASSSQDYATVDFSHLTEPICVVGLSDLHMTSWAADFATLVRVTDELLSIPNLYAILLGDELELAIKLRSVAEVAGNALPPKMQYEMLRSWLEEIEHKVLASCWSNHQHSREETAVGVSVSGQILGERVIHHSGIGHLNALVGSQTYTFALSHVFRGRSMYNPLHSHGRYVRHEGQDREIILAGDSHVPGMGQWYEGGTLRTFINGGSAQASSPYARRHFSLRTVQAWPVVELDPHEHRVTPYWNVASWLKATGRAA